MVRLAGWGTYILGDPGATSRADAIFSGERHFWRESLLQGLKIPWALTKRDPKVVEIRLADWPEKKNSGQSTRKSSRVILSPSCQVVFFIDRSSCLARVTGRFS